MDLDKAKEGCSRLGALLQIYIGPKIFQALMGTMTTLPDPDVWIANEAKFLLEKPLPAFGISPILPPITTDPASHDSLKHGQFRLITTLIQKIEPKLEDLQGPGPAINAYRFGWNAVYYLQVRKYIPNNGQDILRCMKTLAEHAAQLYLTENQAREFLTDPKGKWGPTFALVTAKQKRSLIEKLEPKEPKFPLDGPAAEDVINRWKEGM